MRINHFPGPAADACDPRLRVDRLRSHLGRLQDFGFAFGSSKAIASVVLYVGTH